MPLEPADPQRPGRRLRPDPGLSRAIPWLIGIGGASLLVTLAAFCAAVGSSDVQTDHSFDFPAGSRRTEGLLSTRDALQQAGRSQKTHRAEHGTYTTSYEVLTEEGLYRGVTLEGRYADEDRYCVQATHASGVTRHITEADVRPRRGRCP